MKTTRWLAVTLFVVLVAPVGGCSMIQGLLGGLSGPELAVGAPMQGSLESSDRTDIFEDGSYTDIYEIELTQGQQVAITMVSPTFDTFLSVQKNRNEQLANNDDGIPGTTNSRIDFTAPSAGTFYVAATSLGTGITGAYTVTAQAPGAAAATPAAAPAAPAAAPAAPAAPAAASGNSCDSYQACCDALASQPGMEAMRASCATIQTLRTAPGGCDATWQAMQTSMSANPSAPAACR